MLRRTLTAFAFVLFVSLPAVSHAQGMIPGGWASQFGYQAFAGPGVAGFGASAGYGVGPTGAMFGYAYPGYGYMGMDPYGFGAGGGYGGYPGGYGGYAGGMGFNMPQNGLRFTPPADQAVNAVNPLINSIRRSTKTRRGR